MGMGTPAAAAAIGVSQSAYSKWENGVNEPGDENMAAIAAFLGLTRAEVVLLRAGELVPSDDIEDRLTRLEAQVTALAERVDRLLAATEPPTP